MASLFRFIVQPSFTSDIDSDFEVIFEIQQTLDVP